MRKTVRKSRKTLPKHGQNLAGNELNPTAPPPPMETTGSLRTSGPQFGQPVATPDPTKFTVQHNAAGDKAAYTILDSEKGTLKPRLFPVFDNKEPCLSLADAIGTKGTEVVTAIENAGRIVFHALGDTGNTRSASDQNMVTDKLVSDFNETDHTAIPSFCYNLGDVVYSFGEAEYYYDQFYDPYRDYPAPIFAIAGNHDGMVAPSKTTPSLQAFLDNFCAFGQPFHQTPQAGGLARTAGRQPGVYYTLEAPFVRILGLYSNCLEDPGVISSQKGTSQVYSYLPDAQLDFLTAALSRVKSEAFGGAVIISVHHPPYVVVTQSEQASGKHAGSPLMLADIDRICHSAGIWPHAVLSGHAHNYQRFTRLQSGRETPYVVCGNGGHAHNSLTKKGAPALRAPSEERPLSNGSDQVVFENYDDKQFGYLRVIVDSTRLRIEYHPASDGDSVKAPDDSVTVELSSQKLVHYQVSKRR